MKIKLKPGPLSDTSDLDDVKICIFQQNFYRSESEEAFVPKRKTGNKGEGVNDIKSLKPRREHIVTKVGSGGLKGFILLIFHFQITTS